MAFLTPVHGDAGAVVEIGDGSLPLESLMAVVQGDAVAVLADGAARRMIASRKILLAAMERGEPIYGTTTGVAERKRVTVGGSRQAQFNRLLVSGHRCAQGPPASPAVVRATTLCLANSLARGLSGVRPEVVELLLHRLRQDDLPPLGTLGSLGEADIGALADLADRPASEERGRSWRPARRSLS